MQISKRRLNQNIEKQIFAIFFQMMADIKTPEAAKTLLTDILSETELQVIVKRLAIALFLEKGRSYENIRNTLKVSSATIASVQEMMGKEGMQLALQKVKTEEWAEEWTEKISGWMNKILPMKA